MPVIQYLMTNGPALAGAAMAVTTALIALFMLIPGEQPEKALQAVVDFLKKFSAK